MSPSVLISLTAHLVLPWISVDGVQAQARAMSEIQSEEALRKIVPELGYGKNMNVRQNSKKNPATNFHRAQTVHIDEIVDGVQRLPIAKLEFPWVRRKIMSRVPISHGRGTGHTVMHYQHQTLHHRTLHHRTLHHLHHHQPLGHP